MPSIIYTCLPSANPANFIGSIGFLLGWNAALPIV